VPRRGQAQGPRIYPTPRPCPYRTGGGQFAASPVLVVNIQQDDDDTLPLHSHFSFVKNHPNGGECFLAFLTFPHSVVNVH